VEDKMKKAFTLLFFIFPVLLHPSDKTIIDYYSYLFPDKSHAANYREEYTQYTHIIDEISRKTGVKLNIYQNVNGKMSGEERAEVFVSQLEETLYLNPPDLVNFPYTRWSKWKSLIANGDFLQVDELIKEHAPNLYKSYPRKFWAYRRENGNVYSIPIKRYEEYYDSGFWIIKNTKNDADIEYKHELEVLYENIMKCSNYDRDLGMKGRENYILSFFHWSESTKSWFRLQNVIPLGINEFFYIPGMSHVAPLSLGDIDVDRYKKFQHKLQNGFEKGHYVDNFLWKRWKIAYIPYHQIFSQNFRWKDILPEIFSNSEYEYISPQYSSETVVFDSYDELFIPAGSDAVIETLEFIDTIYSQKKWYDIFMFGTEDFEAYEPDEYNYNDVSVVAQNRSRLFSSLQVFCNKRFTRIPAFYPSKIKTRMHEYFEAEDKSFNEPLYGFDISSAYYNIPNYFSGRDSNLIDILTKMQETGAYVSGMRTAADYINRELERYMD
jgi:hypothetical protein